jgi:arylsulfatase
VVPPKGAPNVLLIMTDDQGYGVSGTFGGVIPTPAMDRIAKAGLRYTQFHSTALCSPTRACAHHGPQPPLGGLRRDRRAGHRLPGLRLRDSPGECHGRHDPEAERLCHIVVRQEPQHPDVSIQHGRAFDQWPVGMGFEYFYGFMGGETDQWTPYLFRNQSQVFPWIGKPGYNLTTDLADDAIGYMKQLDAAAPDKPFFLYYVPGGTHSPHQPTKEWIEKFKGKFDMGWNQLREQIFANQKRLGVIPANTQLTPGRTPCPSGTRSPRMRRSSSPARPRCSPRTRPTPTTRSAG